MYGSSNEHEQLTYLFVVSEALKDCFIVYACIPHSLWRWAAGHRSCANINGARPTGTSLPGTIRSNNYVNSCMAAERSEANLAGKTGQFNELLLYVIFKIWQLVQSLCFALSLSHIAK